MKSTMRTSVSNLELSVSLELEIQTLHILWPDRIENRPKRFNHLILFTIKINKNCVFVFVCVSLTKLPYAGTGHIHINATHISQSDISVLTRRNEKDKATPINLR